MHEGAVTLNQDGMILYCNSYFASMVNLPLQKVIGTLFKNFIDNSSKERLQDLVRRGGGENTTREEVSIYTIDGKAVPALMSLNTFSLDNIIVLSIILTDLTIQNRNREELKSRARELEQKNIELESVNKELAFQNDEKEKRAAELIIANKELAFQNEEKENRAAELSVANKELAFQNEEKEKRAADLIILSADLEGQYKELRRANDEILALNQNLENRVFERTRELVNLNYELKELNLSKDKFLSVISHDLRNPLTALLISSDALSHDTENHIFDGIQPYVKVINRTSHNILQQLNELVEWAKMQHEKANLNSEKLHLVRGVDQSLELLKAIALQKNIVLENKVPPDIYVNADTTMLRSILQNLVTNGIKYTPQNGLITVNAHRIDKMVEICIADSGIGMDAETRENLFSNSNSTSVNGTNNEKGSGIGITLVKDFITQHGGTIRIESELGKGTYIFFTLPEYK